MGGSTMHHYGNSIREALEGLAKEIDNAEKCGLWLDSVITVLEQFKKPNGKLVVRGRVGDMPNTVFNNYVEQDGKWEKPYCAICHVHC